MLHILPGAQSALDTPCGRRLTNLIPKNARQAGILVIHPSG